MALKRETKMSRAIIVVGPESSGTKLITELFVKAGCLGDYTHEQRFDKKFENNIDTDWPNQDIVFRRSIPHAKVWNKPIDLIQRFKNIGYNPLLVVTFREFIPNAFSKINNNHSDKNDAYSDLICQLRFIFHSLSMIDNFYMLSTSHLFKEPAFSIQDILICCGFTEINANKIKEMIESVYDADKKHRGIS